MSTIGEPTSASSPLTVRSHPSAFNNSTTQRQIGFGAKDSGKRNTRFHFPSMPFRKYEQSATFFCVVPAMRPIQDDQVRILGYVPQTFTDLGKHLYVCDQPIDSSHRADESQSTVFSQIGPPFAFSPAAILDLSNLVRPTRPRTDQKKTFVNVYDLFQACLIL